MKRLIAKALVALGAASLVMGHVPSAGAATALEGAVVGQVTVNPTVPVGACIATNYSFGTTAIAGIGAATPTTNGQLFGAATGLVDVTANGTSSCENTDGAVGTVNITACNNVAGVSIDTAPNVVLQGITSCTLGGAFKRTGPLVVVHICGNVNSPVGTVSGCIDVVALFVPSNAGIVTGTTVTAAFAGVFENEVDLGALPVHP